jgi:transcription termination factor Rho
MKDYPVKGSATAIAVTLALTACKDDKIVLVCEQYDGSTGNVALEIDERTSTARLLDAATLNPAGEPFATTYVTATLVNMSETKESSPRFWLLDRVSGQLSRNVPHGRYHCSSGRRF